MLSQIAREELRQKMDETIMRLVEFARAQDDVTPELLDVARLLSEAKRKLESIPVRSRPSAEQCP